MGVFINENGVLLKEVFIQEGLVIVEASDWNDSCFHLDLPPFYAPLSALASAPRDPAPESGPIAMSQTEVCHCLWQSPSGGKLRRGLHPQRTMWPLGIVLPPPIFQFGLSRAGCRRNALSWERGSPER